MRSLLFLFSALFVTMSASAQHENHQTTADTVVKAKKSTPYGNGSRRKKPCTY